MRARGWQGSCCRRRRFRSGACQRRWSPSAITWPGLDLPMPSSQSGVLGVSSETWIHMAHSRCCVPMDVLLGILVNGAPVFVSSERLASYIE